MSTLMTTLGIDRLPPEEQLRLVREILENLENRPAPPLTEAQRQELDRLLAALDAGMTELRSWAEVEARVLGRLRG